MMFFSPSYNPNLLLLTVPILQMRQLTEEQRIIR